MLLTDLPGIESLPAVRVLVVGFGAAWAGDDVLFGLGTPLAWAAEQAAGVSAVLGRSSLCMPSWPSRAIMRLSSLCTSSPDVRESTSALPEICPQQSEAAICLMQDAGLMGHSSALVCESWRQKSLFWARSKVCSVLRLMLTGRSALVCLQDGFAAGTRLRTTASPSVSGLCR